MFPVAVAVTLTITTPWLLPEITCEPLPSPVTTLFDALSIRTPSCALPRSASPVESVPIRLPVTWFPVAAGPEIRTPWRLPEITFPGPTTLLAEKMATPAPEFPRTLAPLRGQADDIVRHGVAGGRGPRDQHANSLVGRDDVLRSAARAADDVVGGILDQDAVPGIPRITLAEEEAATGSRPDEVPLDQVQRRPRADDMDTVAEVGRDQVPGAGVAPPMTLLEAEPPLRRHQQPEDGDQDAIRPVRGDGVEARERRPGDADLIAEHLVPDPARQNLDTLMSVAGDDVVLLRVKAADRRIGRPQKDALERVPDPGENLRVRSRQRRPVIGSNSETKILPDEVPLDQVADVVGARNRNANTEAIDDQTPDDAIRRVDHEPRPTTGTAAVHDDALLGIIAIERVDRVGDGRDLSRVDEHDAADDGRG